MYGYTDFVPNLPPLPNDPVNRRIPAAPAGYLSAAASFP